MAQRPITNGVSFSQVILAHGATVIRFFAFFPPLVFMIMHEAVETSIFSSYMDFLTKNKRCSEVRLGQGPCPVARLVQLVEQRTGVPRIVGSSPTPGTKKEGSAKTRRAGARKHKKAGAAKTKTAGPATSTATIKSSKHKTKNYYINTF